MCNPIEGAKVLRAHRLETCVLLIEDGCIFYRALEE